MVQRNKASYEPKIVMAMGSLAYEHRQTLDCFPFLYVLLLLDIKVRTFRFSRDDFEDVIER